MGLFRCCWVLQHIRCLLSFSSFCSEVAPTVAEAVGDTDDDSTVVERGAAVEDGATDMVDIDNKPRPWI